MKRPSDDDFAKALKRFRLLQEYGCVYAPRSRAMRALIMMERIEAHASAARWAPSMGVQHNLELIG